MNQGAPGSRHAKRHHQGENMQERPRRVTGSRMTVAQLLAEIAERGSVNMIAMDFDMSATAIRATLLRLSEYLNGLDKEDKEC